MSERRPFAALSHAGQVRRLGRLGMAALAKYPLRVTRLVPMVHEENTTFRAEDAEGHRYVLRISRPGKHTLDEVRAEMAWLAALRRETALVVPEPVPTRDGALATMTACDGVPEPRICALFRWVEGRFINDGLTPGHLERVGAFTAHLHQHSVGYCLPDQLSRGQVGRVDTAWEEQTLREVAEARSPDDVALLRKIIHKIRAALDPLERTPTTYGLIHADLHQWNYLFHQGDVRAIDFDDCAFGHHLYDLGVTLYEIYELRDHPSPQALHAALLAGYSAVRPLPAGYERALPAFISRRRIDIIQWQITSREHPAFRARWEAGVTYDLGRLRAYLEA